MSDMYTNLNPRGETCLTINGEQHRLCLTLGALANIETALGAANLNSLQERLKNPSLKDVLLILHALLGGGGSILTVEALQASDVDVGAAIKAIAGAFQALAPVRDTGDAFDTPTAQDAQKL